MVTKESTHVAGFREALEGWTDSRFVTKEEIYDLAMFILYLVNLSDDDGWVYNGHSLTRAETMSRLVVRGTVDGIPHVVFSSGRTPMACIRAFLRKMDEGWLEWAVDRFRT